MREVSSDGYSFSDSWFLHLRCYRWYSAVSQNAKAARRLRLPIQQMVVWQVDGKKCRQNRIGNCVEEEQQIALQKQIITYLQSGKKMDAIKVYKDYYECSLSKAKTAISEIEWELDYERYHESEDPRPYAHGRAQTSDVEIHSVLI